MDKIPAPVLEDCVQLVKANSIQGAQSFVTFFPPAPLLTGAKGNKQSNLSVVYTPASNLKKTASMDVGQVGFKDEKLVRQEFLPESLLVFTLDSAGMRRFLLGITLL